MFCKCSSRIYPNCEKIVCECEKGATGPTGAVGQMSFSVVQTQTSYPGGDAMACVQQFGDKAYLNFVLPRGATGPTGEKGEQGEAGPTGATGADGANVTIEVGATKTLPPDEPAVVNYQIDEDKMKLFFEIPRGATGERGEVGPKGENGEPERIVVADTQTEQPGEQARVVDDVQDGVHNLTFYIPQGETGQQGERGPAGPTPILAAVVLTSQNTSGAFQFSAQSAYPAGQGYVTANNTGTMSVAPGTYLIRCSFIVRSTSGTQPSVSLEVNRQPVGYINGVANATVTATAERVFTLTSAGTVGFTPESNPAVSYMNIYCTIEKLA